MWRVENAECGYHVAAYGTPLIKSAITDKRNVVPVLAPNVAVVKLADNYYFPLVLVLQKSSWHLLFLR